MSAPIETAQKFGEVIPMRVIIENCLTSKFLDSDGGWTKDPELAHNFAQSLRAWEEIERRKLSGVKIVLRSEAEQDIAIPVNDCLPVRKRRKMSGGSGAAQFAMA